MADSDNSTTLPSVIRRELFRATTDPAVAVWREWQAAHEETDRLSREQQRLERKLVEEVGFPKVMIQPCDDGKPLSTRTGRVHSAWLWLPADPANILQDRADLWPRKLGIVLRRLPFPEYGIKLPCDAGKGDGRRF